MDTATSIRSDEGGFTLLEVLLAMSIMVVGLFSVAYGIGLGMECVQMSTMDTIAREKAREAMEDVFTARDTGTISFSQICNIPASGSNPNNCLFVNGPYPMYTADQYGLVNTNNSVSTGNIETYQTPGPDGILGTADDPPATSLIGFQRSILVTPFSTSDGNVALVKVQVTITYKSLPGTSHTVTMYAVMSPYV